MLKIKNNKWEDFKSICRSLGFDIAQSEDSLIRRFYQDRSCPNDYSEVRVWLMTKEVTIYTTTNQYVGMETADTQLELLYDLITNGFIEKARTIR